MTNRTLFALMINMVASVPSLRKRIDHITQALRAQHDVPLFALANQAVIKAMAQRQPTAWGRKKQLLTSLMRYASKINLSDATIFMIAALSATLTWLRLRKQRTQNIQATDVHVFAGFGAASEEYLFQQFQNSAPEQIIRINWITLEGMHQLGCPSLFPILKEIAQYSFGHTKKLRAAIPLIRDHLVDFLTTAASNTGQYVFFRHYWRQARQYGLKKITFLAPDMAAYACIDENIDHVFQQHGLLCLSVLLPSISAANLMTREEASYMTQRLSSLRHLELTHTSQGHTEKSPILLILPPTQITNDTAKQIKEAITWASAAGLKTVLRPSPAFYYQQINDYKHHFESTPLDNLEISFEDSLTALQPILVGAWWSTGLATCLQQGYLPLSFCDEKAADHFSMIYPMKDKVLFWHKDKQRIAQALSSPTLYEKEWRYLLNNQDSELA